MLFVRFHQNQKTFRGHISHSCMIPCVNLFTLHLSFLYKNTYLHTGIKQVGFWYLYHIFFVWWFRFTYPKQKFCEIYLHEVKNFSSASRETSGHYLLTRSREKTYFPIFFLFAFSCTKSTFALVGCFISTYKLVSLLFSLPYPSGKWKC